MMLCALPIFLIGLAVPVATDWHPTDLTPSAIISAQSCATGPGTYAKATMSGAYSGIFVNRAGETRCCRCDAEERNGKGKS